MGSVMVGAVGVARAAQTVKPGNKPWRGRGQQGQQENNGIAGSPPRTPPTGTGGQQK